MKQTAPETPKTHEVKSSYNLEPLMDSKSQIADPSFSYQLSNLCFDLFSGHVKGEDIFQVSDSSLYFQITPSIHHFPEFISWFTMACLDENNYFVSPSGTKILEVTPELIQKALIFPFSLAMQYRCYLSLPLFYSSSS